MNINNYGNDAPPSLLPSRVGETKYTVMQTLPALGQARSAARRGRRRRDSRRRARSEVTWTELAARIKTSYAEYYRAIGNERLTREVLELLSRLEQIAQARYAGGLVSQQDAIRAQLEQTAMRLELVGLENEKRQSRSRLNGLLARDAAAPLADPQALRPWPAVTTLGCGDARGAGARRAIRNCGRAGAAGRRAEEPRPHASATATPICWSACYRRQVGSRITQWGLMFEVNIPLQQETRRSQEREAEAMVGRRALAVRGAVATSCSASWAGTWPRFDAARRTESLIDDPIAAAIGAEPALRARRLRERQGRLRDAAGGAAADPQGPAGAARRPRSRRRCAWPTSNASWERSCEGLNAFVLALRRSAGRRRRGRLLARRSLRPPATREASAVVAAPAASAPAQRKLLYYRNPMGLADTSPTPKKDPMGMDYIAGLRRRGRVDGSSAAPNQIRISTEKIQKLGVRVEAASMRQLGKIGSRGRAASSRTSGASSRSRPSSRGTSNACTST